MGKNQQKSHKKLVNFHTFMGKLSWVNQQDVSGKSHRNLIGETRVENDRHAVALITSKAVSMALCVAAGKMESTFLESTGK